MEDHTPQITWLDALMQSPRWAIATTGELVLALTKNFIFRDKMAPTFARDFAMWEMEIIRPLPTEVITPMGDN